jgi:hypothetical protein
VLAGGLARLDEIPLPWLREQGIDFLVIGCPEDEARWEAEGLAAFTRAAARAGLDRYLAPTGYGKVLDPDPAIPSLYLHTHPQTLQVDSRGRRCARACPNDPRFLEWFAGSMRTLAWLVEARGFVWDAPSFYHSRGVWACRCAYCQRLFSAQAGFPLPRELTAEALDFRRQSLNLFLLAAAAAVQSVDRRLQSVVAPPAPLEPATATSGADDWRLLAANSGMEALALVVAPEGRGYRLPQAGVLQPYATAAAAEGKPLWLWLATEQLHPELVDEGRILARQLQAEAVVWSDYEGFARRRG